MAGQSTQTLQNVFLEHVRSNTVPVTIFLVNGIKLQGNITYSDAYTLELTRVGQSQVIYKQAISTILPGSPVQLAQEESGG
jgi:host factor-I protein